MKDDILNIKNQAIAQITAANDSAEPERIRIELLAGTENSQL